MSDTNTTARIRIPGYQIEREIGRGGIAAVYLAVQESLDREVALKVMSPVLVAEPDFTERFISEGRMVAQLNHPGIVTIFDIADENYQTYIAMEYLSGGSLREKLLRTIPVETILSIVRQMADALAYAHDNGIVHRDVKPENIMFRDNGVPVLTDFGIAKTIGSDTRLTRTGIIVGTPRYISPEQAEGRGTDARSDLYSLGIILYEMLAGRHPFGTSDSIALLYAHVNDPIPDLPDEHRHLQPLVNAAMAKDPDQRVPDCHTLSDMIDVILREARDDDIGAVSTARCAHADDVHSVGSVAGPQADVTPAHRLRPFVIGGVGVLVITFLLVAGLRTSLAPQSDPGLADVSEAEAITPSRAQPEATARPAPNDVSTTDKASVPSAHALLGSAEAASNNQAPAPTGKKKEPGSRPKPPSRLPALLSLADRQMAQGHIDDPAGDNALETYREVLRAAADHRQALNGLDKIARYFLDKSRESAEAKRYQDAQDMIERGLRAVPQHPDLLTFRENVSSLMTAEKEYAEAEKYYWGQGIQRDSASAVAWYRKAADKGHVQAQYSLGVAYADGAGITRDEVEGLRWLRRAAIQGVEDAQFNLSLGLIFGPNPDPEGASQWIKTLAEKNYEPAFQVLGWMYSTGTGVNLSIKESIRWNVKHVMADAPAESSPPERVVETWNRRLQLALAQTRLDQKPPEPH